MVIPRMSRWTVDLSVIYPQIWFQSILVIPDRGGPEYQLRVTLTTAQGDVPDVSRLLNHPDEWLSVTLIPHTAFDPGTPRSSALYTSSTNNPPDHVADIEAIGIRAVLVDNVTPDDAPVRVTLWAIGPRAPLPLPDLGP
jgi:hypothetical protein